MKVRDVMSTTVTTLQADTPLQAAASMLVSRGYSSAPVVDAQGRLVGIASEADLVRGRILPEGVPPRRTCRTASRSPSTATPVR